MISNHLSAKIAISVHFYNIYRLFRKFRPTIVGKNQKNKFWLQKQKCLPENSDGFREAGLPAMVPELGNGEGLQHPDGLPQLPSDSQDNADQGHIPDNGGIEAANRPWPVSGQEVGAYPRHIHLLLLFQPKVLGCPDSLLVRCQSRLSGGYHHQGQRDVQDEFPGLSGNRFGV